MAKKQTRRSFTSAEKVRMVLEIIQEGKASSEVARENNIHPNLLLLWKKEFLENAARAFERKRPDITEKSQQRRIEELENQLVRKDSVIAEIVQENMILKKNFGGQE